MLGSCTVVAVREQQNHACALVPLFLTRDEELVDHCLRRVCKVTKLGLPKDERVWLDERVAEFKTKDTVLGQVGVGDGEMFLSADAVEVVQLNIDLVGVLIVQNRVTLAERSTLDILFCKVF